VQLIYEVREEMQRALKKANIRDVFIRYRDGRLRVTALIEGRAYASFETEGSASAIGDEIARWKQEHFEVYRGEVAPDRAGRKENGD